MKKSTKILPLILSALLITGCGTKTSEEVFDSEETPISEQVTESSQAPTSRGGVLTSKGTSTSSAAPATSIPAPASGFAFDDTQLNTVQEIHTSKQLQYLNWSGEYYKITSSNLSSFGADGRANNSTPLAVRLDWSYAAPSGKTVSSFKVVVSQKQDLSNSFTVNGTSAQNISIYNSFLGTNYFKVIATLNDGTTEESQVKTFKVTTQAPRNLSVGNLPNCRDTGGRTTVAGGTIKQGLIYRTSGNKFDNSSAPDSQAKSILKDVLKVKTEINVADNTGYNISISGTTVKTAFMDYGKSPYSNMSRNSQRIRQVFEILGDENNYPVYYHCRIGTDRTGIVGICLGGLLGIPFNEVIQDYAFSTFAPIDGQRYPNKFPAADTESASQDGNGDDPAKYIAEILAMPGKNFQEQTYYSLLSLGIPASTLDNVINIMTEGNKATITPYNLATANALTLDGGATITNGGSDYKHPERYVELTKDKSASYTLTTEAGNADIVAFLGCTDKSSTTKLASGIDLKIDGVSQTIIDRNHWRCGFGTTSRTSCTGYMFIKLGNYALSAGQHTITIAGKSSTKYNLGSIGVFGAGGCGQGGQGGQGGEGGQTTHIHSFTYGDAIVAEGSSTHYIGTCECGKTAVKWAVNTTVAGNTPAGRPAKLGTNGNYFEYKIPYRGTLNGKLYVLAGVDTWDQNSGFGFFYSNAANLEFSINGTVATITNTKSYEENGCKEGSDKDESKAAMMEVCVANLKDGDNTIKITRKGSRSATMYDFYIIEQ